ncbi:MAG: hypothetical protein Q8J69_00950 [Sphingobacteriaceae bacterium]|nr:hypothetical protein [Sphingobacteriaceae bacterium]
MKPSLLLLFVTILLSQTQIWAQENPKIDSYTLGTGIRFTAPNGNQLRLTGYLQPFAETKTLLGDENEDAATRFRMRRLRMRLEGNSANDRFSYRFQADLSGTGEELDGNSNYLLDAFVTYSITSRIKASFGQRATFTDNRELFMNSNSLQLVERSRLTSAFATIREFGLFLEGNFRMGGGHYLKPYFVLTNGDGPNVFTRDRGGVKIGGRIDYLPFGLFTNLGQFNQADIMRELTPKLVIGANFSHNQGMSSRRGRESGAILYLDNNNQELLPDYRKFGIDFLFKFRGFSMLGEFVKSGATIPEGITQRVRNDGSTTTSFDVNGVEDMPNYVRGRMMLGEAYNIQLGYLFKNGISIDGRYTYLNADQHSFLNNGTFYNRPNYYTLGLSKYLRRNYGAKIQGDVTYVRNNGGINNNAGLPVTGNELISRMIVTFSF